MKHLNLLFLPALFFVFTSCSDGLEGDNSTPNEFGKLIFNAIKHDNKEVFHKYVVSDEDFEYFIANFKGSERERQEMQENDSKMYRNMRGKIEESFEKIRRNAEGQGIDDWGKYEFQRVTFDRRERDGIDIAANTTVEFKSEDYFGYLRLGTLMNVERGWVLADVPQLGKVGPNIFGK